MSTLDIPQVRMLEPVAARELPALPAYVRADAIWTDDVVEADGAVWAVSVVLPITDDRGEELVVLGMQDVHFAFLLPDTPVRLLHAAC